jgi:hypothetical protein
MTFSAVTGRTPPRPFITRSTVAVPTPAALAMSAKVGFAMARRSGLPAAVVRHSADERDRRLRQKGRCRAKI